VQTQLLDIDVYVERTTGVQTSVWIDVDVMSICHRCQMSWYPYQYFIYASQ